MQGRVGGAGWGGIDGGTCWNNPGLTSGRRRPGAGSESSESGCPPSKACQIVQRRLSVRYRGRAGLQAPPHWPPPPPLPPPPVLTRVARHRQPAAAPNSGPMARRPHWPGPPCPTASAPAPPARVRRRAPVSGQAACDGAASVTAGSRPASRCGAGPAGRDQAHCAWSRADSEGRSQPASRPLRGTPAAIRGDSEHAEP